MTRWCVAVLLAACAPAAPSLDPAHGRISGGDDVRIRGADFAGHGALVVGFGDVPARGVVIESDRLVRVRTPPAAGVGPVEVRLDFADGTTQRVPAAFEYRAVDGVRIGP